MTADKELVDVWWNRMDESQKGILRLIMHMISDAEPGQVVEVRKRPDRVTVEVVDRPGG